MVFYWFGWIEIAVVCLFVFIKTAQTGGRGRSKMYFIRMSDVILNKMKFKFYSFMCVKQHHELFISWEEERTSANNTDMSERPLSDH